MGKSTPIDRRSTTHESLLLSKVESSAHFCTTDCYVSSVRACERASARASECASERLSGRARARGSAAPFLRALLESSRDVHERGGQPRRFCARFSNRHGRCRQRGGRPLPWFMRSTRRRSARLTFARSSRSAAARAVAHFERYFSNPKTCLNSDRGVSLHLVGKPPAATGVQSMQTSDRGVPRAVVTADGRVEPTVPGASGVSR